MTDQVTTDSRVEDAIIAQAQQILKRRLFKQREVLGSTEDLTDLLALTYGEDQDEMFGAVLLDSDYGLIAIKEIFRGTVNSVTIHTRPVVRAALEGNASFVILFHNHPSGNPEASEGDIEQTWKLTDALKGIEVRVLDHMIVAGSTVSSFVEQNLQLESQEAVEA